MPFNEDTMALKSLSTVRLVSYSVSMSQEASKKDKRLITICYQLGAILISPSGTSESSFSFTIRTFSSWRSVPKTNHVIAMDYRESYGLSR